MPLAPLTVTLISLFRGTFWLTWIWVTTGSDISKVTGVFTGFWKLGVIGCVEYLMVYRVTWYRVTHLLAEKVMLTSVPSQDNPGMSQN